MLNHSLKVLAECCLLKFSCKQGYVSSRRRRQKIIIELRHLCEDLGTYLAILKEEATKLQFDIQYLGIASFKYWLVNYAGLSSLPF